MDYYIDYEYKFIIRPRWFSKYPALRENNLYYVRMWATFSLRYKHSVVLNTAYRLADYVNCKSGLNKTSTSIGLQITL